LYRIGGNRGTPLLLPEGRGEVIPIHRLGPQARSFPPQGEGAPGQGLGVP
jgi:hypothetical protein